VFLSEWRRLVAAAQLAGVGASPAGRLRELAARLSHGYAPDRPLFDGGPSVADLAAPADTGDAAFVDRVSSMPRTADGFRTWSASRSHSTVTA
jgi:hypothetical protein